MPWYFNLVLLTGVADVWQRLREYFDFGSRAPREEIEQHWPAILENVRQWADEQQQTRSPFVELHTAMFGDRDLIEDLNRFWRTRVSYFRKRGHEFEDVLVMVLFILFWRAARNAGRYLQEPIVPPRGWANPFWSVADDRLARDLERASDALFTADRTAVDVQTSRNLDHYDPLRLTHFSALQSANTEGTVPDFSHDYQGRVPDNGEVEFEPLRTHLSEADYALFRDWFDHNDEENRATIAGRHSRSEEDLTQLLARVRTILRQNPSNGGW